MKHKTHKRWFIQDWGTYSPETLVVVGFTGEEILKSMKQKKYKHSLIESFNDFIKNREVYNNADALCWFDSSGCSILWFDNWKDDWHHVNVLVHETNHLIYNILNKDRDMWHEGEAQAYQQEYLFDNIRRKLYDANS